MKVILLQDVAKIGKRYEVANVPDGYAMNKLIPGGQARAATPENLKKIEAMQADTAAGTAATEEQLRAAVATLSATPLTIAAEANEQGQLFEALKVDKIVDAATAAGAAITADQVVIAEPIKATGEVAITLQAGEVSESVTITVIAA